MTRLGTLEDLPLQYRDALTARNLAPLWPSMRAVLPYRQPSRATAPTFWAYRDIRPLLLEAGALTPIEKAERRVLVLANPGLGLENLQATPTIYVGMQLILPGETAPCHRHTPSAVRFVVEGEGAFTTVSGQKCPMHKGDLILTPAGEWHEHGHEGTGPVIWLDALDLPLIYRIEASFAIEGASQPVTSVEDASQTRYRRAGLLPYRTLGRQRSRYPMLRFPWADVRAALADVARETPPGEPVQLAYVNPETGEECLPALGFSALMLRPGETLRLVRRSASAVVHAVEGAGTARVDALDGGWEANDTFAVPTHADVVLANGSRTNPAFLFMVDDAPLQRKLGIYAEFPGSP